MTEHVAIRSEGPVRRITLARPEKKNALTLAMYEALVEALRTADADPATRVLLVDAEGTAFTGGNDLADFMGNPPADESSPVFQLLLTLVGLQKPVIAAVNGPAVGIGTTMLLHCDVVIASTAARFSLPFVSLALVPEGASSFLLPRMAGLQRATDLLLSGEPFDAATALSIGLASRVVAPEELASTAQARAQAIAALPAGAVRLTKKLLRDPIREEVVAALRREGALFMERLGSPEAMEAFTAFFEKRRPDFSRL
jgi:enoyl-CoA hydratase/carnithine racemase